MAFFGLLGGKKKGYASPWLQLTVVYATSPNGLEPEHKFALRGKVLAAHPLYFEYISPGSFLAFYPGTAAGQQAATQLVNAMRGVARDKSVPAFGVSQLQGECLAQMSGNGRLKAKPQGLVISQAIDAATQDANAGDSA
jgi:hypothetical protein